jgi:hypothetical protein
VVRGHACVGAAKTSACTSSNPAGQTGDADDYTEGFAELTGGRAWTNTNNFDGAVDRIRRESFGYYLLGYPAPINDHRLHTIEVKVSAPGVTVRARRARGCEIAARISLPLAVD